MTKKTFLKKIESNLSSLGEEKIAEIVRKYEKIIDDEVATGKDEKDVVASLGSIDMITKLYIEEDRTEEAKAKTKKTSSKTNKNEGLTDKVFDVILKNMDEIFEKIDKEMALRILTIICYVAIGFIGLSLLYIPFGIFDVIGNSIYSIIFNDVYFYKVVSTFWSFSISACYIILVVWLIVKYTNKVVLHYTGKVDNKPESVEEVENVKKKECLKATGKSNTENTVFDLIFTLLKVFIIILTIPFIMLEIVLFIFLFFSIILLMNGVVLFGPMVILSGLIILVAALLDLIYLSITKGGIN